MTFLELAWRSIAWSLVSTLAAIFISLLAMFYFHITPREAIHEVEEDQNVAVGAIFFVVSIIAALFIGFMASDGFTEASPVEEIQWIVFGLALSLLYTIIISWIVLKPVAHRKQESIRTYLVREIKGPSGPIPAGSPMVMARMALCFRIIVYHSLFSFRLLEVLLGL